MCRSENNFWESWIAGTPGWNLGYRAGQQIVFPAEPGHWDSVQYHGLWQRGQQEGHCKVITAPTTTSKAGLYRGPFSWHMARPWKGLEQATFLDPQITSHADSQLLSGHLGEWHIHGPGDGDQQKLTSELVNQGGDRDRWSTPLFQSAYVSLLGSVPLCGLLGSALNSICIKDLRFWDV